MITLKSAREIEAMDKAGDFLASIHIGLRDLIKPGVDMWEVEEYVRRRCKEENFVSGLKNRLPVDIIQPVLLTINGNDLNLDPRQFVLKCTNRTSAHF